MKGNRLKIPTWISALLLILLFSVTGLGISIYSGSYIPLWILLLFSLIFVFDKWFYYILIRYKIIGILYRILLNLSILFTIGVIIWTGIKLFSMQFIQNPLIGSVIFIGELGFFIWLWKIVKKNSWRRPSMKLTVIFVLAIAIIFAYAGVQPITEYKDIVFSKVNNCWIELKIKYDEYTAKAKIEERKRIEEQKVAKAQEKIEQTQNYAQLFNEFRVKNGKPPLSFSTTLNELAQQRAIEISQPGNFSHEGIMIYNLGENIAMMKYSSSSDSELIELWANSPGHRSNMLSSSYFSTGFGREGKYAVQVFQ